VRCAGRHVATRQETRRTRGRSRSGLGPFARQQQRAPGQRLRQGRRVTCGPPTKTCMTKREEPWLRPVAGSPSSDNPPPKTMTSGWSKWVTCDSANARSCAVSLRIRPAAASPKARALANNFASPPGVPESQSHKTLCTPSTLRRRIFASTAQPEQRCSTITPEASRRTWPISDSPGAAP
jgi:hypothetical protein